MPNHTPLPPITVSKDCNYIAVFLTMACPYRCSYCINEFESSRKKESLMRADDWVQALNRLVNLERDTGPIPITMQGGEPSCHPDFYEIINRLDHRIPIDILTNLCFDVEDMILKVDPERLRRSAPYASIRVSYHPGQVEVDELFAKTQRLLEAGFSVGVYGVMHPDTAEHIRQVQRRARQEGLDFRTKEFLGYADGKLHGTYKYPGACACQFSKTVQCRTTELIIGPDGSIFRCHHDIYEHYPPVGHILDADYQMTNEFRPCHCFGHCNPCDVKVKTNRLQQFGHTSVEIRFPRESLPTREQLVVSGA